MSFAVGDKVEVIQILFLGRWIEAGETGYVEGRGVSPVGQDLYRVRLQRDGKLCHFAPSEIEIVEESKS